MSAGTSVERHQDESPCSVCLEIFQDVVSMPCGHTFCQACIAQNWEVLTSNFSCPQCREKVPQQGLQPKQEVTSVAEVAKRMNPRLVREVEGGENLCKKHQEALKLFCEHEEKLVREVEGGENLCKKHQEALKLFCEHEEKLICLVCDRSKVHRNHSVVPVDEAAREYKKLIQDKLYLLKMEQEDVQSSMEDRRNRVQDYTKRREAAKQKIVMGYKSLHRFLEKQESFLLAQLEQLDTEIMNIHEEILNRLLEEMTSLDTLAGEMERTYLQPHCELLKDIKTTLSTWEREPFSQPLDTSPELEKKLCDFTEKTTAVKEAMEKFQDLLDFEIPFTTQMTLDPKTANARLYLLEDHRGTWWGSFEQDLPSNPERFKVDPCVLGSRGFTSGWHCWEVEIYGEGMWAMGVAKESVPRQHCLPLKPEAGVWALCRNRDGYKALTSPDVTPLTLRDVPQRIRICLDFHEGRVVFFDAVSKARIFAFPQAAFDGERVYPWFLVMGDAHLKISSQGRGEKTPEVIHSPL